MGGHLSFPWSQQKGQKRQSGVTPAGPRTQSGCRCELLALCVHFGGPRIPLLSPRWRRKACMTHAAFVSLASRSRVITRAVALGVGGSSAEVRLLTTCATADQRKTHQRRYHA